MKILLVCVLAFFCGTFAETWDSRGLAVDDSLLMQNVWNNEDELRSRGEDNGWVILPRGAVPDIESCIFPPLDPSDDVDHFNLTGTPVASFDQCSVYISQKWEALKIVGNQEHIAQGTTTYIVGKPEIRAVPHCAHPTVGLAFASAKPEDLFEYYFDSDCWGFKELLAGIKPSHSAFQFGETKLNLCPTLAKKGVPTEGCLQLHDVPASQFGIGVYDSDTDVLAIRRGYATTDNKIWFTEYKTEFSYHHVCSANSTIDIPMGDLVSSFSRINYLSQAQDGNKTVCVVV